MQIVLVLFSILLVVAEKLKPESKSSIQFEQVFGLFDCCPDKCWIPTRGRLVRSSDCLSHCLSSGKLLTDAVKPDEID